MFWLWIAVQTQWVIGGEQRQGLNYPGVTEVMRMHEVAKKRRKQYFILLQHMEQAALSEWARNR